MSKQAIERLKNVRRGSMSLDVKNQTSHRTCGGRGCFADVIRLSPHFSWWEIHIKLFQAPMRMENVNMISYANL